MSRNEGRKKQLVNPCKLYTFDLNVHFFRQTRLPTARIWCVSILAKAAFLTYIGSHELEITIIALTVLGSVACLEVSPQRLCAARIQIVLKAMPAMLPTRVHVCALASHRRTLNVLVAKLALPQLLMAIPAFVNQRLRIVTTHLECSQKFDPFAVSLYACIKTKE